MALLVLNIAVPNLGRSPPRRTARGQGRARAGRFRNVAALAVLAAAVVIAVWNVVVAEKAWIAFLPAILLARRFVPGAK